MRSEEMRDQFNGLKTLIDENIPASEKGAADGVASLDSSGLLTEQVDWSHVANKPGLLLAADKGVANGVASLDSNALLAQQVDWSKLVNVPSLVIATGVAGGQTILGGTAAGNNLTLASTSHATKGKVYLGAAQTSYYGEATGKLFLNGNAAGRSLTLDPNGPNYGSFFNGDVVVRAGYSLARGGNRFVDWSGNGALRITAWTAEQSFLALSGNPSVVALTAQGVASQTAPLLKCVDSASSEQFGIGAAGQIRTNQSANATTPGSVVKKLQVFDSSGNSLGFIPIYDAIT
jgi:hypothetical protein